MRYLHRRIGTRQDKNFIYAELAYFCGNARVSILAAPTYTGAKRFSNANRFWGQHIPYGKGSDFPAQPLTV